MCFVLVLVGWFSAALRCEAEDQGAPASAEIRVFAGEEIGPTNRKVLGQLIIGADPAGVYSEDPWASRFARLRGDGIWDEKNHAPTAGLLRILQDYRPGVLRFPDGLGVHGYDWKKTIGPLENRPEWAFGLEEYLLVCRETGAEPLIVVSEYVGGPQDAADLVEYLNAPATPEHPWAMKRAANGHPDPHGVKYFEMGNESWIDYRKNVASAVRPGAEVGKYATELARAMKAVDPDILCGVPYNSYDSHWDAQVLGHIGPEIDYVVLHLYPARYGGPRLPETIEPLLMQGVLLGGDQAEQMVLQAAEDARQKAGREMPLGLTEYNVGLVQQGKPAPRYRYSLAGALMVGDLAGRLLHPQSPVLLGSYWQWLNGFFGCVRTVEAAREGKDTHENPDLRPAHFMFDLWGRRFADELVRVEVDSPRISFPGFVGLSPLLGDEPRRAELLGTDSILMERHLRPFRQENVDGSKGHDGLSFSIDLKDYTGRQYPVFAELAVRSLEEAFRPGQPALGYRFSFESRWIPEAGTDPIYLGVQIADSRGWTDSGTAALVSSLQDNSEWKEFSTDLIPRPDTPGLSLVARLIGGATPTSGRLEFRNLRVTPIRVATLPEGAALTAYAARNSQGDELTLMVFNRSIDQPMETLVQWEGFRARDARLWELHGPSPATTNELEEQAGLTREDEILVLSGDSQLRHVFPPFSMTAIVLRSGNESAPPELTFSGSD
jgi:alpha-N-arabinofuranosidase